MPGEKWEANVVSFPVFRRKSPSFSGGVVGVMSLREATSCDRARRSTKCPVREVLVLLFSSDRGGNEVKDDYKKRAFERLCSNARCIGEGSWRYFFLPL